MKKIFRPIPFFFAGILFLLLNACQTTPPARNAITAGMPRRDVVLLMGSPEKVRESGPGKEILEYRLHQDINDPTAPDVPYWVFLEDGKVVRAGKPGEVEKSEFQDFEANISLG